LAESDININGLSLADTKDFGVLRFIVDDCSKAEKVLKNVGLSVRRTPVTAVEVPHRPGELFKVLSILDGEEINVEYMYEVANMTRPGTTALIFRFDDNNAAVKLLASKGIPLI